MYEIGKSFDRADALSSVVFIHDYVQLVFQGLILNIYAPYVIENGTRRVSRGDAGYADELVSLIGLPVVHVEDGDDVVFGGLPLFHSFGKVVSMNAAISFVRCRLSQERVGVVGGWSLETSDSCCGPIDSVLLRSSDSVAVVLYSAVGAPISSPGSAKATIENAHVRIVSQRW